MAAGIQVFNADGSVQFDGSGRITRLLGVVEVGGDGSLVNGELARGAGTFFFLQPVSMTNLNAWANYPQVSISGTTVSWSYQGNNAGFNSVVRIYYGTF